MINAAARERHRIPDSLVDEIGETCNCTMLDGDEVVYLDRVETAWPLRVNLQPGSRVPLHCSASGKLFLAHMRREARERLLAAAPLPRYTPNTLCDMQALDPEFRSIRKEGASFDREEYLLGIVCMAVPILHGNRAVAAVALHALARLDAAAPGCRACSRRRRRWRGRMKPRNRRPTERPGRTLSPYTFFLAPAHRGPALP